MKTKLSPAAQAIVNAAIADDYGRPTSVLYRRLAAALRAVAEQIQMKEPFGDPALGAGGHGCPAQVV